jgi:hypothetical protein
MQLCNIIYYSTVHWRLNMFQAAYRSPSGALTVFAASGLHMHVVTGRSQVPTQTWIWPVTTCVCKPEAANTVRAPDYERYAAQNVELSMNGRIINSITRLHLVGYFYWVVWNIRFSVFLMQFQADFVHLYVTWYASSFNKRLYRLFKTKHKIFKYMHLHKYS